MLRSAALRRAAILRLAAGPALAIVALAAACASGGGDDTAAPVGDVTATASAACQPAADSGVIPRTVPVEGVDRAYTLVVPEDPAPAPTPLIVALHGLDSTAESLLEYTAITRVAAESGFVVAAPQAAGAPAEWNDAGGATSDVAFIRAVIDDAEDQACIDPARVYVVGFSDGGGMAQRLACDLPENVVAIAVVAATYQACQAAVPMIAFHGTDDAAVPYEGGANPDPSGGGEFPLVRRTVSEWARALGCDGLASISRPSQNVELSTYNRCANGDGQVLLYTILGGGHTWPGAVPLDPAFVGKTTDEIDASATIIAFFAER
jgi:polyhydroxybutyrate depolymerase